MLEAAASKVNHLDCALSRVTEENILVTTAISYAAKENSRNPYLWLEITMNNTMLPHQSQAEQHLTGKSPDECGGETGETIRFDEFV